MFAFSSYTFVVLALVVTELGAYKLTIQVDEGSNQDYVDSTAIQALLREISQSSNPENTGKCNCVNLKCGCCVDLDVGQFLKGPVCVNVTYLPVDIGLEIVATYNNKVLFDTTLSVKNPKPLCFGIPFLEKLASACIGLYNVDFTTKAISGCFRLDVKFMGNIIQTIELGCFNIPLAQNQDIGEFARLLKQMEIDNHRDSTLRFYGKIPGKSQMKEIKDE